MHERYTGELLTTLDCTIITLRTDGFIPYCAWGETKGMDINDKTIKKTVCSDYGFGYGAVLFGH
jgi:hypothetical protein